MINYYIKCTPYVHGYMYFCKQSPTSVWVNKCRGSKIVNIFFSWVKLHTVIFYWYYLPLQQAGLPLVQQYLSQFEKLVMEHMPKLGQHFVEEMINPSMYASQWFITVFSYSFPFHLTLRVWDVFLYEVRI
jgi:hypothetical protein